MWWGDIWDISVPVTQFCYGPKITLKKKFIFCKVSIEVLIMCNKCFMKLKNLKFRNKFEKWENQ